MLARRTIDTMTGPVDRPEPDREDLLVLGGRARSVGSRLRTFAILAAIVAVAGAFGALVLTGRQSHRAAGHPSPSRLARTQLSAPPANAAEADGIRMTLRGPTVSGRTGARVLVSQHIGWPLAWFAVDTGRPTPLDLPPDAQNYQMQAFPGGVLLRPRTREPCVGCPGRPVPVYYAAIGSRTVTRLGFANWDASITADRAAAWLTSLRPMGRGSSRTFVAQQVDLSGHPLGAPVRVPPGYQPAGGWIQQPAHQLLLLRTWPTRQHYALWDPARGKIIAGFGSVVAVGTRQIAWTAPSCTATRCPLHLTNLTSGATTTELLPNGWLPTLGSYRPDARQLALLVTASDHSAPEAVWIGLLDLRTDHFKLIPGTDLTVIPTLNWSPGGRWLLITGLGDYQLALVNPRTTQLQVTTLPG